jgi:large subunit ribosomal protein LX
MGEVKTYDVIGRITKPNFQTRFQKRIRAVKPEDAVEEVYKTLGSKHRVKRFYIKVEKIVEVAPEQTKPE